MRYRRARYLGGTCFFTVNLANREADLLVRHIATLRSAMRKVGAAHAFDIVAMVVLPEHDADYSLRWSLVEAGFSRAIGGAGSRDAGRRSRRERGIWQHRDWEHFIHDEIDLARHVDDIHFNAVKHGWASSPASWPYSSFHRFVARGRLAADWGAGVDSAADGFGERSTSGFLRQPDVPLRERPRCITKCNAVQDPRSCGIRARFDAA